MRDLANIVKETVPNCSIEYAGKSEPDPRSYRVDFSKLAGLFQNFKPQWNARRGARELYLAYLKNTLDSDEFLGRRYTRLKQLKYLMDEGYLDASLRWRSNGANKL